MDEELDRTVYLTWAAEKSQLLRELKDLLSKRNTKERGTEDTIKIDTNKLHCVC